MDDVARRNPEGVDLKIDGRRIMAPRGATLLDAAAANGIAIPSLCHHRELLPSGNCRLCTVEIDGWRTEVAACAIKVAPGMVVRTRTPRIDASRRSMLAMLLSRFHDARWADPARPETEFEFWCRHYGVSIPESVRAPGPHPVDDDPHPFIRVDRNRCILCARCVRACREIQGRDVWGIAQRGERSAIAAGMAQPMLDARCESCGLCAAVCPTGALEDRTVDAGKPETLVTTTCPYCGVGCNFDIAVREGRAVRVASNPYAPVNGMHLCVKGRYGFDFLDHPDRLRMPRVRRELLEGARRVPGEPRGEWVETDWPTALALVAGRFEAIRRDSGGDAIGVFSSAKCTNEENYLAQKLARQVLGTHNVDHCARLCHASTVAGLAMALGSGAMSNTMRDVAEEARAILVIGSNTTEQHPVFGAMLRQAARRGTKLVVADPRRIDLAEFATLHLRQRPGTDIALINGLLNVIFERGWEDRGFIAARTEGFEALREAVRTYDPARVAAITGVAEADLLRAAEILACEKPMAVVWAMGITQHTTGVANVLAMANLQLALGNLGVPGGGVNPLRGQNNVQGACDMGALPNVFPSYQAVGNADARARMAAAWALGGGAPVAFADHPGLTVTEMVGAAGEGTLRALYVIGENPVMTDPDVGHVKVALAKAELVVLQEIFPSETAAYADVLLPGAAWAEKDGTFTNTERRIQRVREAVEPPGEARPDWAILAELATRILALQGRTPAGPCAAWRYATPAQILDEVAAVTPSYAGVSFHRLDGGESLHWPVPSPDHPGTPILHRERFPIGRGKFHVVEHLAPREEPDAGYPLLLTTGRVLYHWHGGEMTRRSAGLNALCPEPEVEVNPADARRLGLRDGATTRFVSRRGELHARAWITDRVPEGVVFGNFHFPGTGNVNNLTILALDPVAKIPEYKVCAVRAEAMPA
jgi:formate dehydrogenase alpha subunit